MDFNVQHGSKTRSKTHYLCHCYSFLGVARIHSNVIALRNSSSCSLTVIARVLPAMLLSSLLHRVPLVLLSLRRRRHEGTLLNGLGDFDGVRLRSVPHPPSLPIPPTSHHLQTIDCPTAKAVPEGPGAKTKALGPFHLCPHPSSYHWPRDRSMGPGAWVRAAGQ